MAAAVEVLASRMRLKHFRLLKAIDEIGSLVGAANAIAISQPGATKMLNEIEDVLGQRLFERTNKGLRANEVGQCVIRYSRLVLSNLEGMQRDIVDVTQGVGGFVSVGAVMGAVPRVATVMARLSEDHPTVKMLVQQKTSDELLALLDKGDIDIAVCRTSISDNPGDYKVWSEHDETIEVIVNKGHRLAQKPAVSLADLTASPWIVCLADMPMRRHFEREFINAALPIPTTVIETASALAVSILLKENDELCSMQPSDVVSQIVAAGHVTTLNLALTTRSEPYQVVTRRNRSLTHAVDLALERLA